MFNNIIIFATIKNLIEDRCRKINKNYPIFLTIATRVTLHRNIIILKLIEISLYAPIMNLHKFIFDINHKKREGLQSQKYGICENHYRFYYHQNLKYYN